MAQELKYELQKLLLQTNMEVLDGSKVVEVRAKAANKGVAVSASLEGASYEFVMAAGDDWTDEDKFRTLPEEAHTIKIGVRPTAARYMVIDQNELIALLEKMVQADRT